MCFFVNAALALRSMGIGLIADAALVVEWLDTRIF